MKIANMDGLSLGDTENPEPIVTLRGGVPAVINTPDHLKRAARALKKGRAPVALDVGRVQGSRYGNDPYLVQIRREDVGTYPIDTHVLTDLTTLNEGLKETWLLHDAAQDLPSLRQLGLEPPLLFDTEIATRLIDLERFRLTAVCEQVLGLGLVRDHQASDWSPRPLPKDWLRYAALDVELLIELYRRLSHRLDQLSCWEWAVEECAYIVSLPASKPKKEKWRSLPGARKIRNRRGLGVLEALWRTREEIAQGTDLVSGCLVRNAAPIRAAMVPLRNGCSLLQINEFRSPVARPYIGQWLRAITRVMTASKEELPEVKKPRALGAIPEPRSWTRIDEDVVQRLQMVRTALLKVSERIEVTPEVILEPRIQRSVTWAPLEVNRPSGDEIKERMYKQGTRNWRMDLCLDPLADALEG